MERDERLRKKVREAKRLRALPPVVTMRMAFSLMEFGVRLREAGDEAIRRGHRGTL